MKFFQKAFNSANVLLVGSIFLLLILGCDKFGNAAKGKVIEQECLPSTGLINEELDYGVEAKLKLKNVGKLGDITITPSISTSEGEWQRSQKLTLQEGETKTLTYFFHEPTINVRNVQCKIVVSPEG